MVDQMTATDEGHFFKRNSEALKLAFAGLGGVGAVVAAFIAWLALNSNAREYEAMLEFTRQAYSVNIVGQDLHLFAPSGAIYPDAVRVQPRFEIPGKFSDDDTLGEIVNFTNETTNDIVFVAGSEQIELAVQELNEEVCSRSLENRKKCNLQHPISSYFIALSFDGGAAVSNLEVVDPAFSP